MLHYRIEYCTMLYAVTFCSVLLDSVLYYFMLMLYHIVAYGVLIPCRTMFYCFT